MGDGGFGGCLLVLCCCHLSHWHLRAWRALPLHSTPAGSGATSLAFLPPAAPPWICWLQRGCSNLFTCLVLLSGLRVPRTRGTAGGELGGSARRGDGRVRWALPHTVALSVTGGASGLQGLGRFPRLSSRVTVNTHGRSTQGGKARGCEASESCHTRAGLGLNLRKHGKNSGNGHVSQCHCVLGQFT